MTLVKTSGKATGLSIIYLPVLANYMEIYYLKMDNNGFNMLNGTGYSPCRCSMEVVANGL